MKRLLISLITLFSTMALFGQSNSYKLPTQWDKNFVISVSHTGSMSGGSSQLRFTYDSCKSVKTSNQGPPVTKEFALTPEDRAVILKKMNELKVEKIKATRHAGTQHDGWSNTLCFGGHCIEGGSGSKMSEKDKEIFLTASGYLERFAADR